MNKCIMCGGEVFKDIGYVTDGKVFVCDRCAESHSLTRIMTRIENSGYDSNLKSCYSAPIETGLVNQTESANTESANTDSANTDSTDTDSVDTDFLNV